MIEYKTQIAIVGGGPAGVATACTLQRAGFRVLVLERGVFASAVGKFPLYMQFFSTAEMVELCGFALPITDLKPTRQQYLRYLQRFVEHEKIELHTHHEVLALEGEDGAFTLRGATSLGEPFAVSTEKIVLATGAYDHPNLLDVPGEGLAKVRHYYSEVNDYIGQRVMIVGGRHSAAETALELCRAGIDTTIVYRGETFRNLKYWIAPDLENRIKEGKIKAHLGTAVREIKPRGVVLQTGEGAPFEVENDSVLALTGYFPEPTFLGRMGVEVNTETHCPVFNTETLESTRPGVYLAGVLLAGNISGAIFIENSRHHGELILAQLKKSS